MKEDKLVLPTLTPEDAKTIYAAGTDYGFRPLDYVDYTDYKQCIELYVTGTHWERECCVQERRCTFDE